MNKSKLIALFFILSILGFFNIGIAQHKMGDNPTTIDDGSLLELESTNKAFIPPRVTTTQMNAIPSPLEGAIVYNTDDNCLYHYRNINGVNSWVSQCQGNEVIIVALETSFSGTIGNTGDAVILNGYQVANTLEGASFNNSNNYIYIPPGTYQMTFVFEGNALTATSSPTVSSYFFDFPGQRIHNNQVHFTGFGSVHGGSMSLVTTLNTGGYFPFHIGRGSGGNWTGTSGLSANGTFFSAIRILK